jgi:hypothetical protein
MAITAPPKPKPLGSNASQVAAKRYSIKDASGQVTEDWDAIVERVVNQVATAESDYHERECFVRDVGGQSVFNHSQNILRKYGHAFKSVI